MSDTVRLQDRRIERVLLSEARIRERVRAIAESICRDFAGSGVLHMIGILKGAFVFMSDLGREIRRAGGPAVRYDFVSAQTYGSEVKGSGETSREVHVKLMFDDISGRDVLLVEDILDQGFTLSRLREVLLADAGVRSVKLCVLLNKVLESPSRQVSQLRAQLAPDYIGFDVPDRWLAGYGLDAAEDFRELPEIIVVRE